MQLLFFDVETTSFTWDIIQFWAIYWNYDPETKIFHEERIINQYINTKQWIDPGAQKIHWITPEKLRPFKYMDSYIKEIAAYINKADYLIWHNIDFDCWMLKKEFMKCGMDCWIVEFKSKFDTMKWSMEVMWYAKRPKLWELYKDLFWKEFDNAHDALADIRATKDCFFELYTTWKIFLD